MIILVDDNCCLPWYFNISSLREFFEMVNAQNILGFIRDIGLYCLFNLTFIRLIDFTTDVVFKPVVNT